MKSSVLLTDLDNTLYNFIDYFGPSFRAMVHALSKETKIKESKIINDFRFVYKEAESIEYSFTVQQLPVFQSLPSAEIEKLKWTAQVAFSRTRNVRLKLYEGVEETLRWLSLHDVYLVAVTNAPVYHAFRRLRQLGVHRLFDVLVARDDSALAAKHDAKGYPITIPNVIRLGAQELKPSPEPYVRLAQQIKAEHYYVVGDSLNKDLLPATKIGAKTIWAQYGHAHEKKNMDTILSITNWGDNDINHAYDVNSYSPDYKIYSFEELKKIVRTDQLNLFN